jgi:hypothetical protein
MRAIVETIMKVAQTGRSGGGALREERVRAQLQDTAADQARDISASIC